MKLKKSPLVNRQKHSYCIKKYMKKKNITKNRNKKAQQREQRVLQLSFLLLFNSSSLVEFSKIWTKDAYFRTEFIDY